MIRHIIITLVYEFFNDNASLYGMYGNEKEQAEVKKRLLFASSGGMGQGL